VKFSEPLGNGEDWLVNLEKKAHFKAREFGNLGEFDEIRL
jgi:hypothetical protein